MITEDFGGKKILDFEIGEDIMVILLEDNEVFWSGIKMAYKPEKLKLPNSIGKIKLIGACFRCVVVVDENNQMFFKNAFVKHEQEEVKTGIFNTSNAIFGGGNIVSIGGNYRNKFAVVQ